MSDTIVLKDKGLKQLLKAFKGQLPQARVGILGDKTQRKSAQATNATIGAAHEFGTTHLPQRSFLRVPLTDYLPSYLARAGAFDPQKLAEVIRTGSIRPWVTKLGIVGEQIVAEAFASGGFGKWPGWKNPNYKNNANQILVDTTQLRNSISSDVK